MASLAGYSSGVQYVNGGGGNAGHQVPTNATPNARLPVAIDGTPARVVMLALSAAAGLVALHAAGFRFNVGVSG